MALTLLSDAPLATSTSGLGQLQALGQSWVPADNLTGVPTAIEFDDGWLKTTIRETDVETFLGIRAEVVLPEDTLGTDYLYSWEMIILESEWGTNTGQIVVGQQHVEDSIVAAVNYDFVIRDGVLNLRLPLTTPPTTGSYNQVWYPIEKLEFNKLYTFKVRVRWATDTSAYLQITVNDKQVCNFTGLPNAYVGDAPYFKLGVYDAPHNADFDTKIARFRNLKRYSGTGSMIELFTTLPEQKAKMTGRY